MTRLNIAFVVPAGFLGCLTMSAALVVGNAEISQLRPNERRMVPVVETAESPFRVIAGVRVPDPAPSLMPVPSPSAAAAPEAAPLPADVPAPPAEDLLPPADALAPPDVSHPGALRQTVARQIERAPEPAQPVVAEVVDTVFEVAHTAVGVLGLGPPLRQGQQTAQPAYDEAWQQTEPARQDATQAWADAAGTVAEVRQ